MATQQQLSTIDQAIRETPYLEQYRSEITRRASEASSGFNLDRELQLFRFSAPNKTTDEQRTLVSQSDLAGQLNRGTPEQEALARSGLPAVPTNIDTLRTLNAEDRPVQTTRLPGESIIDFTNRLDQTGTPLQSIYSQRSDLQGLYNPDGTAKNPSDPRIAGIPTLQDWYTQYGQKEYAAQKQPPQVGPVATSAPARQATRQADLARIRSELESGTQAPPLFRSSEEFARLRKEQGIVADEEELASLRAEALAGRQELRQFSATAGQGVSEGGRIGAVSEAERNLNFRLEGLALREQAVLARINAKNTFINTALELGMDDYKNAYQNYTNEFNKNLKVIELYNEELDDQQKDALTAFSTITNLLSESGISSLSPELSTQLDTLALQAGLPTGVFQTALSGLAANEKLENVKLIGSNVYMWTTDPNGTPQLKLIQTLNSPVGTDLNQYPASYQEYLLAKQEGYTGSYMDYQTADANRKRPVNNTTIYAGDRQASAQEKRVKEIISANPNEWGNAAAQIDREFGQGTATQYDALLKAAYLNEDSLDSIIDQYVPTYP